MWPICSAHVCVASFIATSSPYSQRPSNAQQSGHTPPAQSRDAYFLTSSAGIPMFI